MTQVRQFIVEFYLLVTDFHTFYLLIAWKLLCKNTSDLKHICLDLGAYNTLHFAKNIKTKVNGLHLNTYFHFYLIPHYKDKIYLLKRKVLTYHVFKLYF